MPLPHFNRGQLGTLGFDDLNQAFDILNELAPMLPDLRRLVANGKKKQRERDISYPIMVLDSQPFAVPKNPEGDPPTTINQWMYSWVFARRDTATGPWQQHGEVYTSNADGDPFYRFATNDAEANNDGIGEEGQGTNIDDPNVTLTMLPIRNGTITRLWVRNTQDGKVMRSFWVPNDYEGACKP